jgi:uncharacterized membrane protein YphA (DoxX/SURF4 family)
MKKSYIVETISMLYMILYLYTGISKLMEYSVFKQQLEQVAIVKPVASVVSILIPITEIVVSLFLLLPSFRRIGTYLGVALMIVFTLYIIYILSMEHDLPCSCGGIISLLTWPQHLILNLCFIIGGVTSIRFQKQREYKMATS